LTEPNLSTQPSDVKNIPSGIPNRVKDRETGIILCPRKSRRFEQGSFSIHHLGYVIRVIRGWFE
jgi:hypothetical protein